LRDHTSYQTIKKSFENDSNVLVIDIDQWYKYSLKKKNRVDPVDCIKGLISGDDTKQKYTSIVFAWANSE